MTRQQAANRFRTRKLSTKQQLAVVRESQIDNIDDTDAQRNIPEIETGVERQEEVELHLQAAIHASQAAVTSGKAAAVYIPTPNAEKIKDTQFDALYPKKFSMPSSYIRFSSTVEDCCGCPYSMSAEDQKFLQQYNSGKRPTSARCSEDTFEQVMSHFETVVQQKQPFLSIDTSAILPYEDFESAFDESTSNLVKMHAKAIYPYWKEQRLKNEGRPIMPSLRVRSLSPFSSCVSVANSDWSQFEQGTEKDDGDPYVCFRRREVRQVRKTRRTDAQSTEKLARLRTDMEYAKRALEMVLRREKMRKAAIEMDQKVFEMRAQMKEMQRKLGIRGDWEDLVNIKQKKRPAEQPAPSIQRPPAGLRIDPKATEIELVPFELYQAQKRQKLQNIVEEKVAQRRKLHGGFLNGSPKPDYTPAKPRGYESGVIVHLPSPPPSVSSQESLVEHDPDNNFDDFALALAPYTYGQTVQKKNHMWFRKRIGRGGRILLDRKTLRRQPLPTDINPYRLDRMKHHYSSDEEDDDEDMIDPSSDQNIRFRARLLSPPVEATHHSHQIHRTVAEQHRRQLQSAAQVAAGNQAVTAGVGQMAAPQPKQALQVPKALAPPVPATH
ncbi:hypothetical protein BJ508DRAFT_302023 [Ascobolus immersus RN42]|uniref:Enhancer of polycomb-like protein n=1 Tax=Ascobolus immersus RN42 TaxID=1160509 RepID=A0A3N4IL16_ASCIM|nr:hypothetical protein BJ508DRAFT_302023 [Ascobolus immersus RN42]